MLPSHKSREMRRACIHLLGCVCGTQVLCREAGISWQPEPCCCCSTRVGVLRARSETGPGTGLQHPVPNLKMGMSSWRGDSAACKRIKCSTCASSTSDSFMVVVGVRMREREGKAGSLPDGKGLQAPQMEKQQELSNPLLPPLGVGVEELKNSGRKKAVV